MRFIGAGCKHKIHAELGIERIKRKKVQYVIAMCTDNVDTVQLKEKG